MSQPLAPPHSPAIVLAHEAPLQLGALLLEPALRRATRDGRSESLEPRVMQALVLLAQAQGAVVGRDELVARCWDGRVVGDNAITRVVSRIRHLSATLGQGCFEVETITRVGYRLVLPPPDARPAQPATRMAWPSRRVQLGLCAGAALLAAAGWGLQHGRLTPDPHQREVEELLQQARLLRLQSRWDLTLTAVELAGRATRLSPHSGPAWALLALLHCDRLSSLSGDAVEPAMAQAREALGRALALAPDHADALAARLRLVRLPGPWAEVEAGYRQALRRHPGHAELLHRLCALLCQAGRWSAALPLLQRLVALQPLRAANHRLLAWAHWSLGQLDQADAVSLKACELWPANWLTWELRVLLLGLGGRPDAALQFAERAGPLAAAQGPLPLDVARHLLRALADGRDEDRQTALAALQAGRRESRLGSPSAVLGAAALGRLDLGFDFCERFLFGAANAAPLPWRETYLLFLPPARPLRQDARFARLSTRLGFEAYWQLPGHRPDFLA